MNQTIVIKQTKIILFSILILGFAIRLIGINFGFPYLYNPDEHLYIDPALNMLKKHTLNPKWFVNPASPLIYCNYILLNLFHLISNNDSVEITLQQLENSPALFYLWGRIFNVFLSILVVWITYKIASLNFNKKTALLSAAILSLSPLFIEHSRLIRPDIMLTLMIMLSLFWLTKYQIYKNEKHLYIAAIFAGLSFSTKYSAGFYLLFFMGTIVIDVLKNKQPFKKIIYVGFTIFAAFALSTPFLFIDYVKAYYDFLYGTKTVHLGYDNLNLFKGYVMYINNVLNIGLGGFIWFILLAAGLYFYNKQYKNKTLILFIVVLFFGIGAFPIKFDRWLIPLLPILSIFTAFGIIQIHEKLSYKSAKMLLKGLVFLNFIFLIYLGINKGLELNRADTRTISKTWIENNLPEYSTIAYEYYCPHLELSEKKYYLLNKRWKMIASESLQNYRYQKVDYIIITDDFMTRHYNEPERYKSFIENYEDLKNNAQLIKQFKNIDFNGPTVYIYKL